MKKYLPVCLIVICWLGIDFCLAQNMITGESLNTIVMKGEDSVAIRQKLKQLEKGMSNYLKALQQQNEGLVESAMINLIKMKYHYPDLDYSQIIGQLQSLEEEDRTQSLRFLAFFTRHFLEDPVNISWFLQGEHEFKLDSDYFFKIVRK